MPSSLRCRPGSPGSSALAPGGVVRRAGHRALDQPRHHPGGCQPDRVGAVPHRRQVDHAELPAGDRVVHRRRPADPAVHDRGVVLGAEDHLGVVAAVGQVERVRADALVVPAGGGHEVHRLGAAPHHAPAVRPQDAGLGVGDRDDEVAVLGGAPQVGLDPFDGGLERGAPPERRGLGLVGQRGLGDIGGDRGAGAFPAVQDLGADERLGVVALLDEGGPGAHGVEPPGVEVPAHLRHWQPL